MRLAVLLFVVCVQIGCGRMEPIPGDTFYRLKPNTSASTILNSERWTQNTLVVERFQANGIYKDRAIALLHPDDVSLTQSKYHYWNDSPEILLQERLFEFARSRNLAETIALNSAADADYTITGRVIRFERVKTADSTYEVSIHLELGIRRARNEREILFQERFAFTQAVPGDEMPDAVALFSLGTDQLLSQFIAKAGKVMTKLPQ